jgi:hypothetical protein
VTKHHKLGDWKQHVLTILEATSPKSSGGKALSLQRLRGKSFLAWTSFWWFQVTVGLQQPGPHLCICLHTAFFSSQCVPLLCKWHLMDSEPTWILQDNLIWRFLSNWVTFTNSADWDTNTSSHSLQQDLSQVWCHQPCRKHMVLQKDSECQPFGLELTAHKAYLLDLPGDMQTE